LSRGQRPPNGHDAACVLEDRDQFHLGCFIALSPVAERDPISNQMPASRRSLFERNWIDLAEFLYRMSKFMPFEWLPMDFLGCEMQEYFEHGICELC
jgi:hypothetical protein